MGHFVFHLLVHRTASITSPDDAAKIIIEGVLLNKRMVCVPKRVFIYAIMKK